MPELRMRVVVLVAIAVAVSNGIGVAPTPELSAELIALHEQAGHRETEAQVSLGFKCRRGEGVLAERRGGGALVPGGGRAGRRRGAI